MPASKGEDRVNTKQFGILPSMGVLALLMSTPAFAQDAAVDDSEDIVVTGTSIRGIAPAGANVLSITEEDVEAAGVGNTIDLLRELPQAVGFFNGQPQPGAGVNVNSFSPIPRVVLRPVGNTTDVITAGGQLTLILVDGHRVVAGGVEQFGVDINMVPPSLLERVEIITDGGSAVYGSDAITGVMNFITRRSFDGVEFSGHYGYADGYDSADGTLTVGRDYGSGSIFASYNYSQHDALFGRDRDYIRDRGLEPDLVTPAPSGTHCATPTLTVTRQFVDYTFNGSTLEPIAEGFACDEGEPVTRYPEQYRHSLTLGWSQDLNETLRLDVRGFFTRLNTIQYDGPFSGDVRITTANPWYQNVPNPLLTNRAQSFRFNFSPVFGDYGLKQVTEVETWQFMPEVSWDIPFDWQVRASATYGESDVQFQNTELSAAFAQAAAEGTTFDTALNPYDLTLTNPDVLASLIGLNRGVGRNQFSDLRVIADGPLLDLPGGELRAAVGWEATRTEFRRQTTNTSTFQRNTPQIFDQDVSALFAELQVPIIGENNQLPLVERLSLQGSIRQDTYSDFGIRGDGGGPTDSAATTTSFGLTYEPIDWVTFSAGKSEAFVAPTVIEQAGAASPEASCRSAPSTVNLPGLPDTRIACPDRLSISGGVPPLPPLIAESYNFSLEVRPPILEGLTLRATFFHTLIKNRSGFPIGFDNTEGNYERFYETYANGDLPDNSLGFYYYGSELTQDVILRYADLVINPEFLAPYIDPDYDPVSGTNGPLEPQRQLQLILDPRSRNSGNLVSEGWDFSASYVRPTDWGSWDARFSATMPNVERTRNDPASPWVNQLTDEDVHLRYTASIGANIDNWRLQMRQSYTSGVDIVIPGSPHDRTDPTIVTDFFVRYDVNGEGLAEDLAFTLNVDNAFFDGDPQRGPFIRTDTGNASVPAGSTSIGRLVQFGVSKRF
jgi:iron complex outermembrane receptor protein